MSEEVECSCQYCDPINECWWDCEDACRIHGIVFYKEEKWYLRNKWRKVSGPYDSYKDAYDAWGDALWKEQNESNL